MKKRFTWKRIILWILLLILLFFAVSVIRNWDIIQRVFLGGVKVYETEAPALPADIGSPAILVFSKTNGFRHEEAIPAANAMLERMAKDNNWGYYQTENGATFTPENLAKFKAVIFNNVSGDVFTPAQREVFKNYVENGGGFVGFHGAGGDQSYAWDWYVNEMIGTQFIGHPMGPQFQKATVNLEDRTHPASATLPEKWVRTDEWYSFAKTARREGYHVLATLDESSYKPEGPFGQDLRMGKDHPIVWWHCQGKGRALYSAIGHRASAYSEKEYQALLRGAISWAIGGEGPSCEKDAEGK